MKLGYMAEARGVGKESGHFAVSAGPAVPAWRKCGVSESVEEWLRTASSRGSLFAWTPRVAAMYK